MSWNDDRRATGPNAGAWPPPGGSPGRAQPEPVRPQPLPPAGRGAPARPAPHAPGLAGAPHPPALPPQAGPPFAAAAPFAPAPAPMTRPARLGRTGFFLGLGSVLPVLASYVIGFAGSSSFAAASTASSADDAPMNAVLLATGAAVVLQWLLLIAATVLGIVSLARRERPVVWGVLSVVSIPASIVCTWILNLVLLIVGLGAVAVSAGRG